MIWADGAYPGDKLAEWCRREGGRRLQVLKRQPGSCFEVVPWRWVIERSFAWIIRNRRFARDSERLVQTAEKLIEVRLMLRRLAR